MLNPFHDQDARLLATVARGEFLIKGFRNADIRVALLGEDPQDPAERRRRTSRISRLLGLLCGTSLDQKDTPYASLFARRSRPTHNSRNPCRT